MKQVKRILVLMICLGTPVAHTQTSTGGFSTPNPASTNVRNNEGNTSRTGSFSTPTTTPTQQRAPIPADQAATVPSSQGPSIHQGAADIGKGNKRAQVISQIVG